ncbi:MAG: DUF2059 domain-containing protein [Gammaproteobacteria bacterium]|nr:DUF2059 domain-containing protein [Gammaproteobacteria bacterium]
MKIFLAIALLLASFTSMADSYDDDLKKLFELTGVKNNYAGLNNVIINQMQAGFFQAADQNIDAKTLTEDQKKQVGEMLKARFGEMVKGYQSYISEKMPYETVEAEVYMPLYKETYSHDEVKELVTFYDSPVGKKTIEFSQNIPEQAAKKSAEKYDPIISDYVKLSISENIALVKKEMTDKGLQ